jgi:hypothetical protein
MGNRIGTSQLSPQPDKSGRASDVALILGGHSFINQLGNDPATSEQEKNAIVEACLNRGIRRFDTTYQPERIAVGKILERLGRRAPQD